MSSAPPPPPRHAVTAADRCLSCGSRLRPDEAWCSLCHTKVAIQGEPDRPGQGADAESDDGAETPGPDASSVPDPELAAVADRMLAELAASEKLVETQSRLGLLRLKLTGSGSRGPVALAVGGGVLLLVLGVLGLTVLGLLL
jgi:hypothetical protein